MEKLEEGTVWEDGGLQLAVADGEEGYRRESIPLVGYGITKGWKLMLTLCLRDSEKPSLVGAVEVL